MLLRDTDIASAFAKSGHFDVIPKLFDRVGITPSVYEELLAPLEHGYKYPKVIFATTGLVTNTDEEQRAYLELRKDEASIGKGELESIAVCLKRGYAFSSLDKRAILTAQNRGVSVITGGAIFKGLIRKGVVTKEAVLKIIKDIEAADNRVFEVEL